MLAQSTGCLRGYRRKLVDACRAEHLNPLMALGPAAWTALRRHLTALLDAETAGPETPDRVSPFLLPIDEAEMQLPAEIGDYTDFYASIDHATRVGKLFRPENPLLPNYKYIPIGYHGRASSIVSSGIEIRRPCGQTKPTEGEPVFGPTRALDYELEVGVFVGPGNPLGQPIPIDQAEKSHLRSVPGKRLVGARHSVVGVSAAGAFPGKELRHHDLSVDRSSRSVGSLPCSRPRTRSRRSGAARVFAFYRCEAKRRRSRRYRPVAGGQSRIAPHAAKQARLRCS